MKNASVVRSIRHGVRAAGAPSASHGPAVDAAVDAWIRVALPLDQWRDAMPCASALRRALPSMAALLLGAAALLSVAPPLRQHILRRSRP